MPNSPRRPLVSGGRGLGVVDSDTDGRRSPMVAGMKLARVLVLAIVVLTAATVGAIHVRRAHERAAVCRAMTALNERRDDARPVSQGTPTVVVLGDSYSEGVGLANPRQSWPTIYGHATHATVYVNAFGGSGIVRSRCPGHEYGTRVDAVRAFRPSMVIVQTGLNDLGASRESVVAAVATLTRRLAPARVALVGPTAAPQRDQAQVKAMDADLRLAAHDARIPYVPLVGLLLTYQRDRLHPIASGQAEIGRYVAARLSP